MNNNDEFDPDCVFEACLDDLEFDPKQAANNIISRVGELDRAARMGILMGVLDEANAETFWKIFLHWWTDCEFPHRWSNLIDLLRGAHWCIPAYEFMEPADQRFFDNLPDPVTIHRGSSEIFKSGVSWTTDKDTAEWFARRFADQDASVASGRIRKQDIWMVFTSREESEVVCDPDLVTLFELSRFDVRRDAA